MSADNSMDGLGWVVGLVLGVLLLGVLGVIHAAGVSSKAEPCEPAAYCLWNVTRHQWEEIDVTCENGLRLTQRNSVAAECLFRYTQGETK